MNLNVKHLLVLLALLMTACQNTTTKPSPAVVESRESTVEPSVDLESSASTMDYKPAEKYSPQSNAAIVALLDKAHGQVESAEYVAAAASLERAIRISPREPKLYLELAKVRHRQGNLAQATQLCKKAIALSDRASEVSSECGQLLD